MWKAAVDPEAAEEQMKMKSRLPGGNYSNGERRKKNG
jgi:hypothetical protein